MNRRVTTTIVLSLIACSVKVNRAPVPPLPPEQPPMLPPKPLPADSQGHIWWKGRTTFTGTETIVGEVGQQIQLYFVICATGEHPLDATTCGK